MHRLQGKQVEPAGAGLPPLIGTRESTWEGTSGYVQLGRAWALRDPLSLGQAAHPSSTHPKQKLLPALTLDPILPQQPAHLVLAYRESTRLQGFLLLLSCPCDPLLCHLFSCLLL